jgi:hypothetical protein
MAPTEPPHESNPDTALLAPVFVFDSEAVVAPPGKKGRERPIGRVRQSADDAPDESEEASR